MILLEPRYQLGSSTLPKISIYALFEIYPVSPKFTTGGKSAAKIRSSDPDRGLSWHLNWLPPRISQDEIVWQVGLHALAIPMGYSGALPEGEPLSDPVWPPASTIFSGLTPMKFLHAFCHTCPNHSIPGIAS